MLNTLVNMREVWENNIIDAIEYHKDYIDFTVMPVEEFIEECINVIEYYFDYEMIGLDINYRNIVIDTANTYEMVKED